MMDLAFREARFHFADAADELLQGERLAGALGLSIDEDGGARHLQVGGAHAAKLVNRPVDGSRVTGQEAYVGGPSRP